MYEQKNRSIIIFNADQRLIKFCHDLDDNVSKYFLCDDKNYTSALFGLFSVFFSQLNATRVLRTVWFNVRFILGDNLELREIKLRPIVRHHSNSTDGTDTRNFPKSMKNGANGAAQLLQPV